jgi:hypothetical protein
MAWLGKVWGYENVFPFSDDGKLVGQILRIQLHIIFQEKVPGALLEVVRQSSPYAWLVKQYDMKT